MSQSHINNNQANSFYIKNIINKKQKKNNTVFQKKTNLSYRIFQRSININIISKGNNHIIIHFKEKALMLYSIEIQNLCMNKN